MVGLFVILLILSDRKLNPMIFDRENENIIPISILLNNCMNKNISFEHFTEEFSREFSKQYRLMPRVFRAYEEVYRLWQ